MAKNTVDFGRFIKRRRKEITERISPDHLATSINISRVWLYNKMDNNNFTAEERRIIKSLLK